jgi:hypothetical protein
LGRQKNISVDYIPLPTVIPPPVEPFYHGEPSEGAYPSDWGGDFIFQGIDSGGKFYKTAADIFCFFIVEAPCWRISNVYRDYSDYYFEKFGEADPVGQYDAGGDGSGAMFMTLGVP